MEVDRQFLVSDLSKNHSSAVVVFVGGQLQFSDRLLRMVRLEYGEEAFVRLNGCSPAGALREDVRLVVLHGSALEATSDAAELLLAELTPGIVLAYHEPADLVRAWDVFGSALDPCRVSYLPMQIHMDAWFSILRLLLCGENYVPREVQSLWSSYLSGRTEKAAAPTASPARSEATAIPEDALLSPREAEVIPLIAEGQPNKAIALKLGLSPHTVKLHVRNIMSKLNVHNRTGAAIWYHTQARSPGGK